ncbi:MAG: mandelate racemase/muconate lactonizing enzyme family protein [Haloferacaceae archaeon]
MTDGTDGTRGDAAPGDASNDAASDGGSRDPAPGDDTTLREFSLDLNDPLATARGEITTRRGLLVGVERRGVRGVGEATPLPGWTEPFEECLAALAGTDGGPPLDVPADPSPGTVDLGDVPETPAARHGLALARLDAAARRQGESLAARLVDGSRLDGKAPGDRIPVNATVGDAPPDETAGAVRRAAAAGFPCVKVKVGVGSVARDVERLRAARAAVGDDVDLRADANGAWDRETAVEAVGALRPLALDYVEQPLPASDLDGHRALRGRGVRVALDESLVDAGIEPVLARDAADVVVLKPMALGGPDRAVAAARRSHAAGVDPVVTTTVDAAVARTAAVHVAAAIPDVGPCGLATRSLLADDLAPDPVPVEGGRIGVPAGPGLAGGTFDGLV